MSFPAKITYIHVISSEDRRRTTCYPSRENHARCLRVYVVTEVPVPYSHVHVFFQICARLFQPSTYFYSLIHVCLLVPACMSCHQGTHRYVHAQNLWCMYRMSTVCTESALYVQNVHCMHRICTVYTESALYIQNAHCISKICTASC